MTTASNIALADQTLRTRLATRLRNEDMVADGDALAARQAVTNASRLATALTALDNLEARILSNWDTAWDVAWDHPFVEAVLLEVFTQAEIDALQADDRTVDPQPSVRFLKLVYRIARRVTCRAVARGVRG